MSSIIIERPLQLKMDLIEIEDYFPSFRMKIEILISHPTGSVSYQADDIWFSCTEWDIFINNMKSLQMPNDYSLLNMSQLFELKFKFEQMDIFFAVNVEEPDIEVGSVKINYLNKIDLDVFSQIKSKFYNFSTWW